VSRTADPGDDAIRSSARANATPPLSTTRRRCPVSESSARLGSTMALKIPGIDKSMPICR
jgi:hypothetical protein